MATPTRLYTRSEKLKRARLLAKGAHNAYGDTSSIDRQIDRIDTAAEDRARREREAHQRAVNDAKDELAAARVAERCAPRQERQAAREARRAAEKRLRLVERAAR
jgi:hypothetical protein